MTLIPGKGLPLDYEDTNWIVICAIIFDVLPEFLEEIKGLCPIPRATRRNESMETTDASAPMRMRQESGKGGRRLF